MLALRYERENCLDSYKKGIISSLLVGGDMSEGRGEGK